MVEFGFKPKSAYSQSWAVSTIDNITSEVLEHPWAGGRLELFVIYNGVFTCILLAIKTNYLEAKSFVLLFSTWWCYLCRSLSTIYFQGHTDPLTPIHGHPEGAQSLDSESLFFSPQTSIIIVVGFIYLWVHLPYKLTSSSRQGSILLILVSLSPNAEIALQRMCKNIEHITSSSCA